MDTQERLNRQAIAQEWMIEPRHPNSVILVLLVTLGSFMVGLIPLAYASALGNTQSQTPTTITAGEAGLWSVLGEKDNASAPKQ